MFYKNFSYFDNFSELDFARSGNRASQKVHLEAGLLKQFNHAMEPHLRKLGLSTKLNRGVPELLEEYTICKEGDILTPEQARLLVNIYFFNTNY